MRCLTLAETLHQRGLKTHFVCRAHSGNLVEVLQQRAMTVTILPACELESPALDSENYDDWLGVSEEKDAEQTIGALRGVHPDWLIVDHYGLSAGWERQLRSHAANILSIDDIANRSHDCDLLLDQNYSEPMARHYDGLIPDRSRLLLGPRYALLRPEYADYRKMPRASTGKIRRALIFFGGSDPHNVTGMALAALSTPEFRDVTVDVVVGANNRHRVALQSAIEARSLTNLYGSRLHLADLMAIADVAIGAGGVTTWERMCLGLPSLVISIARNQEPACKALSRSGLIRYLGDAQGVSVSDIGEALKQWARSPQQLFQMSLHGQLIVDGLGTLRVSECIDPTPARALSLRSANEDDASLYFNWANEPEVRRQAIHSEPISWEQHTRWFSAKLASDQCHLLVMQAGQLPVGQIRFDQHGAELVIDYSIDLLFRGRGWAQRLVELGIRYLNRHGNRVFRAEVKESNFRSAAVFLRLGFIESAPLLNQPGLKAFLFDSAIQQLTATGR